MKSNIYLKDIKGSYANDLVDIINSDEKLKVALYSKQEQTTADEFIRTIQEWQVGTNSRTFAIILENKAIGTISLSHIDEKDKSAQVGYWIGSNHWNKGYTTLAFQEILNYAKDLKIESISCSIKKDNVASKAIWEKFKAEFEEDNERIYPKLRLLFEKE